MQEVILKNVEKDYRSNEAYKTLRTNVEFSGADKKVIVFSSCTPNEGKSTVSLSLAMSLAEGDKNVLFVDADLRKSVLVGRHQIKGQIKGLSHFLSGQADAKDVIAKYPDMEIAEIVYDEDDVEKAYKLTREILAKHQELAGIICCNMSNPVGAARAVTEAGRQNQTIIVGMDHDQEALRYLRDGVIYALGVQDCYSIGFDTLQVAVKIADGHLPGEIYPEKTEEMTTIIYQDGAAAMLQTLYGELD